MLATLRTLTPLWARIHLNAQSSSAGTTRPEMMNFGVRLFLGIRLSGGGTITEIVPRYKLVR
jgi:hypothetical protein